MDIFSAKSKTIAGSAERRIEECDAFNVNVQVLSTVPVMFSYWAKPRDGAEISTFLNDEIAEIVEKFPKTIYRTWNSSDAGYGTRD